MSNVNAADLRELLKQLLSGEASSVPGETQPIDPAANEADSLGLRFSVAESGGISILGSVGASVVVTGGLTINLLPGTVMPESPRSEEIIVPRKTAKQLLATLERLLVAQEVAPVSSDLGKRTRSVSVPPVSEAHLRALRLIYLSPLPLRPKDIATMFPEMKWTRLCRELAQHGWLRKRRHGLSVPAKVGRWLEKDSPEMSKCQEAWIVTLEPLKGHTDAALILGLMYIRTSQLDSAITVLSDVADSLEPGSWNALYLGVLEKMRHPSIVKRLRSESVVRLHNSIGLCLADLRRWQEAEASFLHLRRYSIRVKSNWGIGQSYINAGVVYDLMDRDATAEKCYRAAVVHAKRTHDVWLLGRSLHNLGLTILERDPDAAGELIEESIRVKVSVGDVSGSVNGMVAQSRILEARGDLERSTKLLRRAERAANSYDLRHIRCKILWDLGRIQAREKKYDETWRCFSEARRIASEENFEYEKEAIAISEAVACVNANQFVRAEGIYEDILRLIPELPVSERRVSLLHDLGVVRHNNSNVPGARNALARALELSLQIGSERWIYLCRYAEALTFKMGVDGVGPNAALRRFARAEERANRYESAGRLWTALCRRMIRDSKTEESIVEAAASAVRSFEQCGSRSGLIEVQKTVYVWRRETGRDQEALVAATRLVKITKGRAWLEEHVRALDEQAVCLQKSLRYREAEVLHRQSLRLAQGIGSVDCIKTSLNNLGELLRKMNRAKAALAIFSKLMTLERYDVDPQSWISVSINHALALHAAKKPEEARALLQQCERRARQYGLWREVVRAMHTRANQAWTGEDEDGAERLYLKALDLDRRHGKTDAGHDAAINYTSFVLHQIETLLRERRTRAVLSAFSRAQLVCKEYELSTRSAELFIKLGDSCWNRGGRSELEALKLYCGAMNAIASDGLEEMIRIGVRAMQMALHLDRSGRTKRIEQLERRLRRWFSDSQGGSLKGNVVEFLTWPLRAARALSEAWRDHQTVPVKVQIRIAQDELRRAIEQITTVDSDVPPNTSAKT